MCKCAELSAKPKGIITKREEKIMSYKLGRFSRERERDKKENKNIVL